MQQAQDFLEIDEALAEILRDVLDSDWSVETGCKFWTRNDVIKHHYFWNEFARVVTKTRNIKDTKLTITGPVATDWMKIAQCFAGPPETLSVEGTHANSNSMRPLKQSFFKDKETA